MTGIAVVASAHDARFAEEVRAGLHAAGLDASVSQFLPKVGSSHVVLIWSAALEAAHAIDAQALIGLWSEERLLTVRRDATPLPLGLRDLPSLAPESTAQEVCSAVSGGGHGLAAAELKKLGRYDLIAVLGKGAMGTVYEGMDPKLHRRVAVRTIGKDQEESRDPARVERFMREAQSVARLNHPHIVQVYDFGEEGELAYIVMEFIKGKELKNFFDANERFELKEAVRVMCELLDALDFAHEGGIVHRDIKPANVMLDAQARVKLTGFGVSILAGLGARVPAYMSPEQITGGGVDRRSDIFSAGIILYQLLTGEQPFAASGAWTILKKITQDHAPLPSSINNAISPLFDNVVNKALAKTVEQRYQTAKEFAAALKRALEGKSDEDESDRTVVGSMGDLSPPAKPVVSAAGARSENTTATGSQEVELEFWRAIKDGNDPDDFELYVQQFPTGIYAALARRKVARLRGVAPAGPEEAAQERREIEEAARREAEARRKLADEKAKLEAQLAATEAEYAKREKELSVAVLFAGIEGKQFYDVAGERVAKAAIDECVRIMRERTEAAKGRVIKTMGDEVMSVFPTADDAADAAIQMQERITELKPVGNSKIGIRIGFNFGPIVEQADGDIFGDAVNVAARLSHVAVKGQIITARDTVMLMVPIFKAATRKITSIQIKGAPAEVEVYELMWQPSEGLNSGDLVRKWGARLGYRPKWASVQLRLRGRELLLSSDGKITASIGSDTKVDLAIEGRQVSPVHCRIERRLDKFVLTDLSDHGTFITVEGDREIVLRRKEFTLRGRGWISFGQSKETATDVLEFACDGHDAATRARKEADARGSRIEVGVMASVLIALAVAGGGAWYYFSKGSLEKQAVLTSALERAARASEELSAAQAQQLVTLKRLEEARAAESAALKAGDQAKIKETQEAAKRTEAEAARQTEAVKAREAAAENARKKAQDASASAKMAATQAAAPARREISVAAPAAEAPKAEAPQTQGAPAQIEPAAKAEAPRAVARAPMSRSEREPEKEEQSAMKEGVEVAASAPLSAPASSPAASAPGQRTENVFQQAQGMEASDPRGAVKIYRSLARNGNGPAAKRLGEIYGKGIPGIPRDYAESLQWYEAARMLGENIDSSGTRAETAPVTRPAKSEKTAAVQPAPAPAMKAASPEPVRKAEPAPVPVPAAAPETPKASAAEPRPEPAKSASPMPTPEPEAKPGWFSTRGFWITLLVLAFVAWRRYRRRQKKAARREQRELDAVADSANATTAPKAPAAGSRMPPEPATARQGDATLFVSYSHKDRPRVEPIVSAIEEMGRRVWMDRTDITGQTGWAGQIVRAIRECRAVVLMASPNSYSSDQVVRELYLAMNHKKTIVPIEIEPAEMPDELQYILAPFQHHRLSGGETRAVLGRALAAV